MNILMLSFVLCGYINKTSKVFRSGQHKLANAIVKILTPLLGQIIKNFVDLVERLIKT